VRAQRSSAHKLSAQGHSICAASRLTLQLVLSPKEAFMHVMADRSKPLPTQLQVESARDHYLAENGFSVAEYDSPRTPASVFGIRFSVPNTPKHRWAIMLHDLHHVATGYGTDSIGEAEISAWELRSGWRSLGLYVGSIVVGATLFGLLLAPRRVVNAFREGGPDRALFSRDDLSYEALLQMNVGELRAELAIPESGLAKRPRALHDFAPAAATSG
jgi:hypothetical protein